MFTRRDFAKLTLAGVPFASALARINSKVDGVQLGVQSYSFRDLSFDDALKAMVADGLGDCELFSPHIEGGHTDTPPMAGFHHGATPEERKAKREEVRQWRLSVPLDYFKGIRKRFDEAGVNLYAYNYSFAKDFTDAEIDRGFEFAKALGVGIITASTTLPVAQRVVPFAEKHKILVAMHGHSDLKDPNQFARPESFAAALKMCKLYRVNLDIGHFTAANFDAVDYITKNHQNIVLLHLKDRKKDEGANVPWGEGDTPIKQVLLLLKETKWPIPAFIEYEYKGTGTSQEEVKKCFDYCKQILA
jgi:sugar phosphate isomerase/epimerase